jgi:thiosulfate/3-mercaptopyruvate sulfurtransferase
MIETYFGLESLDTHAAFFMALVIGLFFGFSLERAGFGSSRRLTGLFYFRDMAVLKVMFTALITAMLGLAVVVSMGWINPASQLYMMKTYYGTQAVAGLLFGVGFVMGGWCPGTAMVGLASGKIDALVFLLGAVLGSVLFNELFPLLGDLYRWGMSEAHGFGQEGLAFIYESLGMPKPIFTFLFTCMAVALFWASEAVERKSLSSWSNRPSQVGRPFLAALSVGLVVMAGTLFIFPVQTMVTASEDKSSSLLVSSKELLTTVAEAEDHIEPEELAERLYNKEPGLLVVDIRPRNEFETFHIRGAVNVELPDLPVYLEPYKNRGLIILYSNGMTHAAQARDVLQLMGFNNAYLLTDGLRGFVERCLKPVSLRAEPVFPMAADKINQWRAYFNGQENALISEI